jgi:glycerate-2-kinase
MIRNSAALANHGDSEARETLLDIADYALESIHPAALVPGVVTAEDGTIRVEGTVYDLDSIDDIYVLGTGKGSLDLVAALLERLPDRVTEAVVVEKKGQAEPRDGIEVFEAGHPIPDADGRRAGERVVELARRAGEDDLVFACITGGTSAQLPHPPETVSIDDLAALTELLLHAGLPLEEMNTVRKHVSRIKGGQLAELIHPARTVTTVIVDEVAAEPWGPTVPDETTFEDAIGVLQDHDLWSSAPASVREYLQRGSTEPDLETPDGAALRDYRTQTVVLADASDVCEAAAERADARGYDALILSTMLEGESAEIGVAHAGIAKETRRHDRPIEPPCVLVSGGETTVSIDGDAGRGGPNQEFALRFALEIDGWTGMAALALGTDGTDGPTEIAGGLVDTTTADRATELDEDLYRRLRDHDAAGALERLDDAVYTGSTGTNVMDLRLVLVDTQTE